MLKDKLGQEILVGMYVIKPWDGCFDLGRVVKVNEKTFVYEEKYIDYNNVPRTRKSTCKVPWNCLAVPEILANYWSVLEGV